MKKEGSSSGPPHRLSKMGPRLPSHEKAKTIKTRDIPESEEQGGRGSTGNRGAFRHKNPLTYPGESQYPCDLGHRMAIYP